MDKLKYIKLENEDGSYSNSIPLAVDSDHVDVNGNTLTNELSYKANNSSINDLQINKINKTDIVDNLNSTSATKVLSANQGKILDNKITTSSNLKIDKNDIIDNLDSTNSTKVLSAKQGNILNGYINTINTTLTNKANINDIAANYESKTEHNNDIANLSSQIAGLASGSPLVASSVAGMTDTTKTYVNTTDGKWYYYDGDSWEIGGTYQSTGIGKNNVSMYNLDTYINNSVDGIFTNMTTTYEKGKCLLPNATESTGSEEVYCIFRASLLGGERLKLRTSLRGQDYSTSQDTCIYAIFDENDNILENHKQRLTNNLNDIELNVDVPENASYIKINCNTQKVLYLISSTTYKQNSKISYDDLDNTLKTKFSLIYNTVKNPVTFVDNAYITVGSNKIILVSAQGYKVLKYNITPGKHYLLKNLIGFYSNISFGIGGSIDIPLTIGDVTYTTKLLGGFYKSDITGSESILDDYYLIAPPYATCLYVNVSAKNQNIISVTEANSITTETYPTNDLLYGKKYVACGDSFTHGDFTGYTGNQDEIYDSNLQMYKTYPYWIGQRNNMTIINAGINGSIMALDKTYVENPTQVDINTRNPFSYQRYQQVPSDADYITIMFGLNDMFHTNLGTIDDTTNETFYGAGNVVLEWLMINRPNAKIGIIISNFYLDNNYRQALRELAVKWGIGYLDLYNDTSISKTLSGEGMCETAQAIRNAQYYVSETNHHPNVKAHIIISHAIEDFLRKL